MMLADIASGETDWADIMFLIAIVLAVVAAWNAWPQTQDRRHVGLAARVAVPGAPSAGSRCGDSPSAAASLRILACDRRLPPGRAGCRRTAQIITGSAVIGARLLPRLPGRDGRTDLTGGSS